MDFKICLNCARCECSFELRPQDFKARSSMECPNCGQAFPPDVYKDLKSGVAALGKVPEYVNENSENPFSENLFTVQVKSYGALHNLFDKPEG